MRKKGNLSFINLSNLPYDYSMGFNSNDLFIYWNVKKKLLHGNQLDNGLYKLKNLSAQSEFFVFF